MMSHLLITVAYQHFLCEFARKHVTVALSGDGGMNFLEVIKIFLGIRINKLQRLFGYSISKLLAKILIN